MLARVELRCMQRPFVIALGGKGLVKMWGWREIWLTIWKKMKLDPFHKPHIKSTHPIILLLSFPARRNYTVVENMGQWKDLRSHMSPEAEHVDLCAGAEARGAEACSDRACSWEFGPVKSSGEPPRTWGKAVGGRGCGPRGGQKRLPVWLKTG